MASFNNPQANNAILSDLTEINQLLTYLAKMNPSLGSNVPKGALRIVVIGSGSTGSWKLEQYDGTNWNNLGKMAADVATLNGYTTSTTAKANTIPVYNASGQLVGNITGNAPTATKLATARNIQVGGIAASTAQAFNGTANITIPINSITINNSADNAVNGTLTTRHGGTGRTDGAAQDVVVSTLASGTVLAKAYGQIGMAATKNNSIDLNALTVDGRYYFRGNPVDWDKNHWPGSSVAHTILDVISQSGGGIVQLMFGPGSGGAWQRYSTNKGAAWTRWMSMAAHSSSVIYISKSGNDLNIGLSSAYPVLTWGRAIQVAEGIMLRGATSEEIIFRAGEGNWGNVTFRSKPWWISIQPYDGGTATAYSTSLPVFGVLAFEYTGATVVSCVVTDLVAQYSGYIYLSAGYKRIGRLRADHWGYIQVANQNAATNLIEFTGGGYAPFMARYHGSLILEYINFKLCGNLTTQFIDIYMCGNMVVNGNAAKYIVTSFSATGRKYVIQTSTFYDFRGNGSTSWLDSLPGSQAGTIDSSSFINGHAMGDVKKTGDTMTGELSIQKNGRCLFLKDTGLNRSAAPTSNQYRDFILVNDAQNANAGHMRINWATNSSSGMSFYAHRVINGVNKYAEIGGTIYSDGHSVGYAPTPPAASNTSDIATTAWVRTFFNANKPNVNNTTITGSTLSGGAIKSSTIEWNTCKMTGTSSFTPSNSELDQIANLYYVHQLSSAAYYGMCPQPTLSTNTYKYNTWVTPVSNGYIMCSFTGYGTQYWRIGSSTSSYNELGAGSLDGPLSLPVQKSSKVYVYDSACSGKYIGWMPAIANRGWTGTRPAKSMAAELLSVIPLAIEEEAVPAGSDFVYLVDNGDGTVEAFGDLPSLADRFGYEIPDPNEVSVDGDIIQIYYDNGMYDINDAYEKGVANAEEQYASELAIARFDVQQTYANMTIDVTDEHALPVEQQQELALAEAEREVVARRNERLDALKTRRDKAIDDLYAGAEQIRAEAIAKAQAELEDCYRRRNEIFNEVSKKADLTVSNDQWNENYCAAHIEDGKIILGATEEAQAELLEKMISRELQTYDAEVARLERQKRFAANAAMYVSTQAEGDDVSSGVTDYVGMEDEIDAKLREWDLYALSLTSMKNRKGYPWDGGRKKTPWPDKPLR